MVLFSTSTQRHIEKFTITTLKIFIGIFFVVFVVVPLIFKYSYKLQRSIIFPTFIDLPRNSNYSNPFGIKGLRNFYLQSEENVKLGVWQILPDKLPYNATTEKYFEDIINNGQNIVIYYHGEFASRAATHRIALYKILRKHFHVITFDYRGYGDSSPVSPTESTAVRDCIAIYKWVMNKTRSKIFVWGHSLGTGLALHMLSILSTENIKPAGLILESPFTNMRQEISEHPFAQLFRALPWFHYAFVEPLQENNFTFASDMHIMNVDCPIVILHAEDDQVIPYELGYKLYDTALKYRRHRQGSIELITFPAKFGYGHKYIHKAPELSQIIAEFVSKAIREIDKDMF